MATPNLGMTLPTVGGSADSWGDTLNSALTLIDGLFVNTGTSALGTAATLAQVDAKFITGMIMLWSGASGSVPTGWRLCDGTGGTPDLRDRFVVGAGSSYAVGASGGSTSQTPSVSVASHALSLSEIPYHDHGWAQSPHGHSAGDSGHQHGTSQNWNNLGPFQLGRSLNNPAGSLDVNNASVTDVGYANISISANYANISFSGQGGGAGHSHGATASALDVRPPYYALCFIMKT